MLQALREKSSGWVATVILGLLIVPFALFGVSDYMSGRAQDYAARIKTPPAWWQGAPSFWPVSMLWQEDEIAIQDFRNRLDSERMRQRQEQGEAFDSRAFESLENKRRILEAMIDERLGLIATREAGMAVSDEMVRRRIQSYPEFQVDGRFNAQRYQAVLATANPPMSPLMFERIVRDELMSAALSSGMVQTAFVSPKEGERILNLLLEKRDVDVVHIELKPDVAEVSAAEQEAWYQSHAADYRSPETVTLEYVEVNAADLEPKMPDEAQLLARYEAEKSKYGTAEQRQVSHILLPVDASSDAATQKAAEEKARKLAAEVRAGADFAALAKANSGDTGSAAAGGDLGWIERNGMMVKPFEDAVFAVAKGGVSDPVKTDFGWHVIWVRDVRAGSVKPFAEVRAQIEREMQASARERTYNDLLGTLVDDLMKNPSGFAEVAAKHGLQLKKAGPVAKGGGEGIMALPAVQREAFAENRIQSGNVSEPINITAEHSVLLRVLAHADEKARPLSEVRDAVIADVRAKRSLDAAKKAAEAMAEAVRKGQPLAQLAAASGGQVQSMPGMLRHVPMPTPEAVRAVFNAPHPSSAAPSAGQVAMPDGSQMVFQVTAVHEGKKDTTMPASERSLLQQQLAAANGGQAVRSYIKAKRKQARIDVVESQL